MNRGDVKLILDRCVAHDVPDAADLIERQAAQIEMLRKALKFLSYMAQTTGNVMGKDAGLMDGIKAAEQALSTTPDQALEQFAAKVREQCADVCDLTHKHGLMAHYAAAAIRAITEIPK